MPGSSNLRTDRSRRARKAVVSVVALFAIVGALSACESTEADRNEVIALVNQSRADNGLRALKLNVQLSVKADAWAQKLRDACALSHSRLADGAPKEWQKLGENVGYGGTIDQVQVAYMNSPGHRANILDASYTQMGAAAVYGDCDGQHRVFTVQEFMAT